MTADFRMLQMSTPLPEVQSGPREVGPMKREEIPDTEGNVSGFGRLFQQAAEELDDEPTGDAATDAEGGKDLPERQSTEDSEEGMPASPAGPPVHTQAAAAPEAGLSAQEGGRHPGTEPSPAPAFDFDLPSLDRGLAGEAMASVQASDTSVVGTEGVDHAGGGSSLPIGDVNELFPASGEGEFSQRESGKEDPARSTGGSILAMSARTMEGARLEGLTSRLPGAERSPFAFPAMPADRERSTSSFVQGGSTPLSTVNLAGRGLAHQETPATRPVTEEEVMAEGELQLSEGRSTASAAVAIDASVVGVQTEGDRGKLPGEGQGLRMATAPTSSATKSASSAPVAAGAPLGPFAQQGIPADWRPVATEAGSEAGESLQEDKSTPPAAVLVPASGEERRSGGDRRSAVGNIQWASLTTGQTDPGSHAGNPGPGADTASPDIFLDALEKDPGLDMGQYRPVGDARFPGSPAVPPHGSLNQGQALLPIPEGRIEEFPGHKSWEQSMARQMLEFATSGTQHAVLRLQPDNLGTLDVRLHTKEGEARIQFSTPHALVKDAVEGALPRLREMFHSGGLNLVEVNVSGHDSSARQQAAGGDGQGNQPHRGHSPSSLEGREDFSSERLSGPGDNLIDCYI